VVVHTLVAQVVQVVVVILAQALLEMVSMDFRIEVVVVVVPTQVIQPFMVVQVGLAL
jgi:hypothetical protein